MAGYGLATSLHFKYDRTCQTPITHEIERLYNCGFKNLDFNFLDMCINPASDFLKENYLEWLQECRVFGDKLGVRFVQAHAPCESIYEIHNYDLLVELCIKAIRGCEVLGIPWMVFHPIPNPEQRFGLDDDYFGVNIKFFKTLLPYAEECGVGMALENLLPRKCGDTYTNPADDLIYLIDTIDSPYIGACWDFGHAHLCNVIPDMETYTKQSEQLRKLNKRLKCTHVHDNCSKMAGARGVRLEPAMAMPVFDAHIAPFMGDIDWNDVIEGLDAIGYEHYFTYEAHKAAAALPDDITNDGIVMLRKIGEALLAKSRL